MNIIKKDLQHNFFKNIRINLPSYQNFAQTIADILETSINEAYKKIRGESNISLEQIIKLSEYFNEPFVYSPQHSKSVTFNYPNKKQQKDMNAYLNNLLIELVQVHKTRERRITVATDDIPLFHFFKYPELTAFKLFFWSHTSNNDKFCLSSLNNQIKDVTSNLNKLYLEIPSTEIWSKDTINGTLEQIKYMFEAGYIVDKELALLIIEQLRNCLIDINTYAISKKKTIHDEHSFEWYNCDVLGSITYLIDFSGKLTCFNRFNTYNYLKTSDQDFCTETKMWMEELISKSTSFSGQGEKYRNRYLQISLLECDRLKEEIENL